MACYNQIFLENSEFEIANEKFFEQRHVPTIRTERRDQITTY